MDRAFLDAGFEVVPGCEIDPEQADLYSQFCGQEPLFKTFEEMSELLDPSDFDLIIGGPPCQSLSIMRSFRAPKFADFTTQVAEWISSSSSIYILENVRPLNIPCSNSYLLDAMHYASPHQSRARYFTTNLDEFPAPKFEGDINTPLAYPTVIGRIYGPRRGSVLQGVPDFWTLNGSCKAKQKGLAMGVHYEVAAAWANLVKGFTKH